jgi:aspartate kinase
MENVMSAVSVDRGSAAPQQPKPVVMKFGGTSVENAGAIVRLVDLVKHRLRNHPVVVVSALAGVTDQLLEAGTMAAKGQLDGAVELAQQVERRHEQVLGELFEEDRRRCLRNVLAPDFAQFRSLLSQIASAALFSPRLQDHLLGLGECLSSKIVAEALLQADLPGAWSDARACVVTDTAHAQATPLWDESDGQIQAALLPLLAEGKIPVLGGYVGATRDGIPTTLGRGGSDFSASIFGSALQAARIEIWTDVDGILSTDPALCPDARRVPSMSFEEAADLAYFGAKVLHPATVAPAMRKNIPVWVLNSRNPESRGTEIVARPEDTGCSVKAISVKKGIAVVDVEAVRWLAPELLREIFDVFERHNHSLDLLSASRGSLSLFVSSTAALPAIAEQLRGLANVRWENGKALVCLVGERVRRQPEIASQAFRVLADLDLRMICQGASESTITFLVDEGRADEVVRRLHEFFFPAAETPATGSMIYPMCQAGGAWQ